MILIFGFRVRFSRGDDVVFFCPSCGGDRHGHHGHARRWFTLFFLPVIPLNVLGEFVQCGTCSTRYEPSVLDRPTTANLHEILANAVRVLTVLVVRAGAVDDPTLRGAAVRSLAHVVPGYDDDTLASDLTHVDPATTEQYVAPLGANLETPGKERFLADLARVALAGGTITGDQRWVIEAAGRALGLTPVHVTGVVASATAQPSPTDPPA